MIRQEWRKVRTNGHVEKVLEVLQRSQRLGATGLTRHSAMSSKAPRPACDGIDLEKVPD